MDAKVIVKYRGVAIEWEEKDTHLIVPPLTVEGMEKASDAIVAHDAVDLKAPQDITKQMALKVPIVMLALQRNYPEITEAEVKSFINGDNATSAMYAAIGLDRWNPKIKNVGEAPPVLVQPPTGLPPVASR